MTSAGGWSGYDQDGDREPGARRRKLAGYLKAANELRQTYQESYKQSRAGRDGAQDSEGMPGSFPDTMIATARNGDEEMLLFPSYARRHFKMKPTAIPGTIQETAGGGRDVRDTVGSGDAEFWQSQWEQYEDDNAIVDVDVRGWIYNPHKGPLGRKNRVYVGIARQVAGIPAPSSPNSSAPNSRSPSPHGFRQRLHRESTKHEEEIVAKEAETLLRRGEAEAAAAGQGQYSERPSDGSTKKSDQSSQGEPPAPYDDPGITPIQKRESWNAPAQMSQEQLTTANTHLMSRLKPFLANPLATVPISAFFYNDKNSRQKTIDTDASGHFNLRAALDFVPTHVRVLASEGLSATEEVSITEPHGVSVISDVDDTIKHSAIGSGAREIFRNVFIRDLSDLTIQGVKELYQRLAGMGVKFHYVSNSPWQLYPVLSGFFAKAGLPPGSFHLKQYSGMFQGIFEPVAERKKGTLERLMRDFPDRRFILFGDSGEADLEVYTDLVTEHPGRILGVFIRDVTTSEKQGFFDSSMGPNAREQQPRAGGSKPATNGASAAHAHGADDPELRAGIEASLKSYDADRARHVSEPSQEGRNEESRPSLPARRKTEPPVEENLIDLDSEEDTPPLVPVPAKQAQPDDTAAPPAQRPPNARMQSTSAVNGSTAQRLPRKPAPPVPPKKSSLSSTKTTTSYSPDNNPATTAAQSAASSSDPQSSTRHPSPPKQSPEEAGYRASARTRLNAAYERLPSPGAYLRGSSPSPAQAPPSSLRDSEMTTEKRPPLPSRASTRASRPAPPSTTPSYAASAKNYASSLYNSATSSSSSSTLPPNRQGSTTSTSSHDYANLPSSLYSNSAYGSGGYGSSSSSEPAYQTAAVNKKAELWKRRWQRAKAILEDDDVVLESWRRGGDVERDVVRLVERALREGDGRSGGAGG